MDPRLTRGWNGTIFVMETIKNPVLERVNPRMLKSEPLQRCCLEDCKGACCVFGVWVDLKEVTDILRNAELIKPHLPESRQNSGEWFAAVEDNDKQSPSGKVIHTAIENVAAHYGGTACVFCREDAKCALQVAAVANGLHPWRFKPYYCILHPLDIDKQGRITLDKTSEMVNTPGSCVVPADHPIPLIQTFESELRYLLGDIGYNALNEMSVEENLNENKNGKDCQSDAK